VNVKTAAARAAENTASPRVRTVFLVSELVRRDLRSRYVGSVAGPFWAVLSPLAWLFLYSFVFSVVLRIPLLGEPKGISFPEFLLAGFLPWLAVQEGLARSASSLSDNAAMVKKSVFPKRVLVATVVLSAAVNEVIGLSLYAIYLGARGHLWFEGLGLIPLLLALQLLIVYGLGCVLACLNVFLRDTPQLVGLGLAMLSFLTPIFYPAAAVPERFRWVVMANPFARLVEAYRDLFFRRTLPGPGPLLILVAFALSAALFGSLLFSKTEPHFADLL
jgi:lipopolysaccharide transport system permease protein